MSKILFKHFGIMVWLCLFVGCPAGEQPDDLDALVPLPALNIEEGCNPFIGQGECMLPFPSDFFLEEDPSLPSGNRVTIPRIAELEISDGRNGDVTDWLAMDGFALMPSIVATFLEPTSNNGFVSLLDDPENSLSPDTSRSLIINATTLEPVAHYIDLDSRADDLSRQAIVLRPWPKLDPNTRYIVALFDIESPDGDTIDAPEAFKRVRDQVAKGESILETVSARYETDVFPAIELFIEDRQKLQLAWDFTTGSEEHVTEEMFRMRELTRIYLEENEVQIEVSSIEEKNDEDKRIWRTIEGEFEVPLFLTTPFPGAEINRDENGDVVQNGTAMVPFVAEIPFSVRDSYSPGRMTCFGHGFFGDRGSTSNGQTLAAADALGGIVIGIDWWGMSNDDESSVFEDILSEPYKVMRFGDRVHQAMVNWLTLQEALMTTMVEQDAFKRPTEMGSLGIVANPDGDGDNGGALVYDSAEVHFFGASQGHILGGVLAALSLRTDRFALNVGGAGFNHMLFRAGPFQLFAGAIMQFITDDALNQQKFAAQVHRHFDRIDPAVYAPFVLNRPLENSPADRQVLVQAGLGDNQVPNVASFVHGMTLGVGMTQPSALDVWGIPALSEESTPSGMTVYDFGLDLSFYEVSDIPPDDNGVHGSVSQLPAAIMQLDAFLKPGGVVIHPCDGPCDPE